MVSIPHRWLLPLPASRKTGRGQLRLIDINGPDHGYHEMNEACEVDGWDHHCSGVHAFDRQVQGGDQNRRSDWGLVERPHKGSEPFCLWNSSTTVG